MILHERFSRSKGAASIVPLGQMALNMIFLCCWSGVVKRIVSATSEVSGSILISVLHLMERASLDSVAFLLVLLFPLHTTQYC